MDIDAIDAKVHLIEAFLHSMGSSFREFIAERMGTAGGVPRSDPRPAAQATRNETLTGDAAIDRAVEEQRVREQRRIDQDKARVEQASHGMPVTTPTEVERLAAEQQAIEDGRVVRERAANEKSHLDDRRAAADQEAERSRMNATAVDRLASGVESEVVRPAERPGVGQTLDPMGESLRGMR